MQTPCPICDSASSFMAHHPEADLYRCRRCTHAFSHLNSIRALEEYQDDYFAASHKRWFDHPNIRLFARLASVLPQSAKVLDAGCGRGDFLRFLRDRRPDLHLAGIDLSLNANGNGIRFFRGDILELDINETFDAVVSLAVIEHIPNVRAFVQRLYSFTKPGGIVIVMTLKEDSLLYGLARAGNRVGVSLAFNRLYSNHHLHHFTRKSLRLLLEQPGLFVESEFVLNSPLAAIDIPVAGTVADAVLRVGMWGICMAGELTGRSYLQTVICRRPPDTHQTS